MIALGVLGGLLFSVVYSVEGATRTGYNALSQPISALSLGPGGWVQRVNFAVVGTLVAASGIGWRRLLRGGPGGAAFPALQAIAGTSLLADGIFSEDALTGYPPGVLGHRTVHGDLHIAFASLALSSLTLSWFVLARRLCVEPGWRRWAAAAVIASLVSLAFIAAFEAVGTYGHLAGLFERLSSGADCAFGLAVTLKLCSHLGLSPWRAGRRLLGSLRSQGSPGAGRREPAMPEPSRAVPVGREPFRAAAEAQQGK